MPTTYYAKLTPIGEAKLANAAALEIPLQITQMGVGDGNGVAVTPEAIVGGLANERRRAALNTLSPDPLNANQIIAEQVIPEDIGGWYIRELGLYDIAGDLIAVANCPETYKPVLAEGSGRTQVIRMVLVVSSTSAVQLKIDPAVVLATRQYCDDKVLDELNKRDAKQSVRAATTAAIVLNGLQNIDGVALVAGDRVLVKDQAAGADNGIYLAAAGAWTRAADADSGTKLTAGGLVPVEAGTVNGDTIWMVKTDGAIIVGATPIEFQWAGGLSGPTQPQFDNSPKRASTAFVQRSLGNARGKVLLTGASNLTSEQVGNLVICAVGTYTVSLPPIYEIPDGASFEIYAGAGATITLSCSAGNFFNQNGQRTTMTVRAGESVKVARFDDNQWAVFSGGANQELGAAWSNSLTANGWRKLPGGDIEQWGTVVASASAGTAVTLPIAFPSANFGVVLTPVLTSGTGGVGVNSLGLSSFNIWNGFGGALTVYWRAIGK